MAFIRYKQRNSKWYVYEVMAFWDPISKTPKQKTRYLGISDSKGGEIIKFEKEPLKSLEKSILDFGNTYAINQIAEDNGLIKILKSTFEDFDTLMTLICYQMTEGCAMYNCKEWAEGNIASKLFPSAKLGSQNISRLINHLGQEDVQTHIEHFPWRYHRQIIGAG